MDEFPLTMLNLTSLYKNHNLLQNYNLIILLTLT